MFGRKCPHVWKEIDRKAYPTRGFKWGGGIMGWDQEEMIHDAFYGYTLILQECTLCKKKSTDKIDGTW